jgi:formamidopyrimidine-DNA glycosylase
MPELPEVETLSRQLQHRIAGEKIRATRIYDHKLDGLEDVRGRTILGVCRLGKSILIMLDDGGGIVIHLRMTGRLFWRTDKKREPHTRWRMALAGGSIDLVDPRRFATVKVVRTEPEKPANDLMGRFNLKHFLERQAGRRVPVKILLMDTKAVAGIGNIYACEILHGAGISPVRQAAMLGDHEWKKIFSQARRVLKKAIAKRGTSISDWRDLYGCPGENQNELQVYGREGTTCCVCKEVIVRIKQGGRSTFYCPRCQK